MIFAVQSTPWLLAHELRLSGRAILSRPGMNWRAPLIAVAFVTMGVFLGGPAGLALRHMATPLTPAISRIALIATGAIFTLMLSRTLAAATEALYARGDLDLLFSSPIAPARVLFVRCAAIAANAFAGFAILISPLAIPVAILARPGWLAIYPVLAALALAATAAGLIIAIGLFRLIGPKRTRMVSQLLAVLIGAAIFITSQIRNLGGRAQFGRWAGGFPGHTGPPIQGPLSWPLRAATGEPWPLLIAVVASSAIFVLATACVGRRFGSDAATASGAAIGGSSRDGGEGAFVGGVFRVTLRKELRLLRRDIPLLAQVLLRVVYLLPLTFVLLRNAGGHVDAKLPLGVGIVAFVSGQVSGSLVWITLAAEDAPELIESAPAAASAIRRAKLCAALAPLAVLMAIPCLVMVGLSPLAGLAMVVGCVAAGLSSALIGFTLEKPARRSEFGRRRSSSLVAGGAQFGAGAVIAIVAGSAVVWPPLMVVPLAACAALGWAVWRGAGPAANADALAGWRFRANSSRSGRRRSS